MDVQKLVDDYNDAWNRQDIAGLLTMLDKRAKYYDAFWMEYCFGRDLTRYLHDCFDEEEFWYERHSDITAVDNSVFYCYTAYERTDAGPGAEMFQGAEILTFRDEKIVTVSDFYCNPDPAALVEVARLAEKHHGETRNAPAGLTALKALRFRSMLIGLMVDEQVHRDVDLTQASLAKKLGSTVDQLTRVIGDEFGTNFHNFLDQHRIRYAKELLLENSKDPDFMLHVAKQSGFRSTDEFNSAFRRLTGETPDQYWKNHTSRADTASNPSLH